MIKTITRFLLLFTLCSTMSATAQDEAEKQEKLLFDSERFDFGTIQRNKPAEHEFTVTNATDETIIITNVKTSCGCTVASWPKNPLKPGEKGMIAVKYNALALGAFKKSFTVETSEGILTLLNIQGTVE